MPSIRPLQITAAASLLLLALSYFGAYDRATWWMEVAPVLIAWPLLLATHARFPITRLLLALVFIHAAILIATRRRFPLTPLLYCLLFVHALILMLGGHYTYARVPLGFWMQDWFGLARNPYDGIGHLAQGFIPAIAARELLLRKTPLKAGAWAFTLVTAVCLAISALYELIEWGAAVAIGQGADEFLGTQGDPWDTQKDMALAWLGAMLAQMLLARWHDRQLRELP